VLFDWHGGRDVEGIIKLTGSPPELFVALRPTAERKPL
jgi:hypothetical protein